MFICLHVQANVRCDSTEKLQYQAKEWIKLKGLKGLKGSFVFKL